MESVELCSSFTLLSPHVVLVLRFPIPDLRPLPKRRPPTQRAVRPETLVLELTELELKHQEAPDLQIEQNTPGQPWAPCLTQLLEASFTDLHGENCILIKPIAHHCSYSMFVQISLSFILLDFAFTFTVREQNRCIVSHQVHMKAGKVALFPASE